MSVKLSHYSTIAQIISIILFSYIFEVPPGREILHNNTMTFKY